MRIVSIAFLLLLPLGLAASPDDRRITFTGELSEGQTFRRDIGRGLDLVLEPSPGETTGWTLEVLPQGKTSGSACGDLLAVAPPPYHFENARYLGTEYGIPAQDAVRNSPREFSFVLNCADFQTESKRVELAIYPSGASQTEVDDALAKLGTSPLGKGKL